MAEWIPGRVLDREVWSSGLYILHISARVAPFTAGQFVRLALDIGDERVARPYSVISPPDAENVEVLFNEVPGGPLSGRLALLEPGQSVWVTRQPAGLFTLAAVPDVSDLWLMATGTGIGPYLSMLRTEEFRSRFERVVLVHAVRSRGDLVYRDWLESLAAESRRRFTYLPVTSRERTDFSLPGRIPDLVSSGDLEVRADLRLSAGRSHVMLCGNQAMIRDTIDILGERGMQRHLRSKPGHITTEKYH